MRVHFRPDRRVVKFPGRRMVASLLAELHVLPNTAMVIRGGLRLMDDEMLDDGDEIEIEIRAIIRKVRPLYLVGEYETAAYAFMRGIDYVTHECPNAIGATQLVYKEALDRIEAASPGTKLGFVQDFDRRGRAAFDVPPALGSATPTCAECGMPTYGERCAFCGLVAEIARERPAETAANG